MDLNDDDEDAIIVKLALQNQLILQEIFKFLPLETLLVSSQINKFWNVQVRTYIRDHRKCTVSLSSSSTPSPCVQLEQLDQDLARMTIVPFNSLIIPLKCHPHTRQENVLQVSDVPSCENITSKMRLRYLQISWHEDVAPCPVTLLLILRLLLQRAGELKSLCFQRMSALVVQSFAPRERLEFPRLEQLEICNVKDWLDNDRDEGLLKKILDGAPNLQKIAHDGDSRILRILPQNRYKLLEKFVFDRFFFHNEELLDLTRKLVESGPRISELSANFDHHPSDIPSCCHSLFQSLVQSCSGSLKKLKVSTPSPALKIGILSTLPNVTFLSLNSERCRSDEFIRQLGQLKFGELFPKLEKFDLHLGHHFTSQFPARHVDRAYDLCHIGQDPLRSSMTLKILNLSMELCPLGLLVLKDAFPNPVQLTISPGRCTAAAVPYQQIFRFWPDLKTLVINCPLHYYDSTMLPNCDADFCGIHKEELELLWEKDEEYLRNVHIVPVRPCLATMKSDELA